MNDPSGRWLNNALVRTARGWDWGTIGLILGVKALLFIFAANAFHAMEPDSDLGWMEIWKRWDALHYLRLAQDGYVATSDARFSLAFFPLFPWLVRAIAFVTQSYIAGALFVSGIASVAAGLLIKQLAQLDQSDEVAEKALWFLLIFPTSYFLHVAYTEGLYLALVLGCFFAARTNRWFLTGMLGACACFTRVNGLILLPALAMEIYLRHRETRKIDWRWLWVGLIPFGFFGYLLLNYHVTGDFFAFVQIQHEHWYKAFEPPWVGIHDVWLRIGGIQPIESSHEFFFIALSLLGSLWCAWKLRASYTVWMLGNWLLITSTSFIVSVPRFTLTMFPIYLLLARATQGRRLVTALLSFASLLYLGFYVSRFVRGLWAF